MQAILKGALPAARGAAIATVTTAMLSRVELILRFTPEAEREALFDRHLARWAGIQLRILGVDLVTSGQPPATSGPRLVVANHRSAVDILISLALFGGRILSRGDIADWPVFGQLARRTGTIFVDRDSSASGASAIRTMRRALREGHTLTVFPEGTTYPGDEVRPFKAGAFAAVSRMDVEIVPVGVAYPAGVEYYQESFGAHLGRFARRRETRIGVAIGEPRMSAGARAADLAPALHEEVQALTHAARELTS